MTSGAATAAAIRVRSERRIVKALRDASATGPGRSAPLAVDRTPLRGALRMLVRRKAVVETGPGVYWLDETAYAEHRNLRRSRLFLVLFGVAAALIVAATVTVARAETPPQASAPRPDQLAFRTLYEELIETNTTLSEGSCTLASERMGARLTAAGFPAADVRVLAHEERPKDGNLAAVLHGSDPSAPPLLLLAHIDVVEANPADWERDPFTLVEEKGYFYARGATDDKAQAAVWVDTLIRLKQQGFTPRRDIKLALTCGEETADTFNGVAWLLENHPDVLQAGFGLNEGARGRLDADGNRVALEIQAGEKVYQDFQLEVTNPGGHSSRPVPVNAIDQLSNALVRLGDFAFPTEPNATVKAYFTALAPLNPAQADELRMIGTAETPAALEAAATRLSAADPAWNAILRTTCTPTMVNAGHAPNALPQRARATINCRILPSHTADEVKLELERVLADPAVVVSLIGEPDPVSPPSPLSPAIVDPIRQAAAALWPDIPVVPSMSPGATDGRFTNAAGIPTYGVTGFFADPDGGGAHGLNERIRVRSLYEGRDFLFELVRLYAARAD